MRRWFVAVCLLLCGCSTLNSDYKGPDAGALVFSVGYLQAPLNLSFCYREIGAPNACMDGGDGYIAYNASLLARTPLDYQGRESGAVKIHHLKPGAYEVYTWNVSTYTATGGSDIWPSHAFSLPFTIKPGRTTYIGTFEILMKGVSWPLEDNLAFLVADRHERDLPIARRKDPNLPPEDIQVTDVSRLGIRDLLSEAPK